MFRGFNVKLENQDWLLPDWEYYVNEGISIFQDHQEKVLTSLHAFMGEDGILNGTQLQESWFPLVEADLFLSHSHRDETLALALSGWLYDELGIKAFIDSSIWGNANDLLKMVDEQYCIASTGFYDYTMRNQSTALHSQYAFDCLIPDDRCSGMLIFYQY